MMITIEYSRVAAVISLQWIEYDILIVSNVFSILISYFGFFMIFLCFICSRMTMYNTCIYIYIHTHE